MVRAGGCALFVTAVFPHGTFAAPAAPAAPAVPAPAPPPASGAVEIRAGTKVVFTTAALGARMLSARDVFIQALSPFDRSSRLKTDKDVTEAQFLTFVAAQAREWTGDEKAKLTAILRAFRTKSEGLALHFPSTVFFIKTTGLEEGRAAYCRGSAIVIPENLIVSEPAQLEHLVYHELFHIYRTHWRENRRGLYAIIGFDECPEIDFPAELRSRKITNPDAPALSSYIRVDRGTKVFPMTPVLFARTERYDTAKGGEFFESLVFKLLVLDEVDGRLSPSRTPDGKAVLVDVADVPDYTRQVGKNTQYIIHPEEILADNFALLLEGAEARSPEILQKMRAFLTKGAGASSSR